MEEWRSGRDSVGRTHEAHWKILLEGTKVGQSLANPYRYAPQQTLCCDMQAASSQHGEVSYHSSSHLLSKWHRPLQTPATLEQDPNVRCRSHA